MTAITSGKRVAGGVKREGEEVRDRPFIVAMVSGACIDDVLNLMAWIYL
jgi:hypothetical protein